MKTVIAPIGQVPRTPVIELINEEFGEEATCTELIGWQKPYLLLGNAMQFYAHEHLQANGQDPRRILTVAKHAFRIWGPEADVTKIDRAKTRHYVSTRQADGVRGSTIRRELSLDQAAINHNKKEERIKEAPRFVKPQGSEPRMRWLTRDEHRTLTLQPMSRRARLFLLIAFGAGARSHAIEELTWDRVHWASRTVDFRCPGVVYRNKRRVIAPIGDVLFRRLEAAHVVRNPHDPYVIGRGNPRRHEVASTYPEIKKLMQSIGINEEGVARHVARHTFCSWLIQAGASYAKVGRLVGDSAIMIEKVYGHLSPDHVRDEVNLALIV